MVEIRSAYGEDSVRQINGYLDKNLRPTEKIPGEFDFFVKEARKSGGPVLELASGAGRIAIVLAEAGIEVFGIEASWPMLELGAEAILNLSGDARRRIHFIQGDMRSFAFKKKFPLIIIPFSSFWFNFSRSVYGSSLGSGEKEKERLVMKEAKHCIKCILASLEARGKFIVDTPWLSDTGTWWKRMARKHRFSYEVIRPYNTLGPEVLVGRKK